MKHDIKLCEIIHSYPLVEGVNKTKVPYLTLCFSKQKKIDMPQTTARYVCIILSGSFRLFTPSGIKDYVSGDFFVSEIDTSVSGHILTVSKQYDFLALIMEFTPNDVLPVLLDLDGTLIEEIANSKIGSDMVAAADKNMLDSVYKLFSIMEETPMVSIFMNKHIKREIIFFVLCGSCGTQFLKQITNIRQVGEIYKINSWIKENFRDSFTVGELAEKQNMSVSLFHQKFKNAVGMAPLQCQKQLRLTEAQVNVG
ncbi:MAG: AraC family transcriptional regulator [Mailhella sp.]|nr:AraC family transcriptional regulator [Mailhella sp.]